MSRDDIKGACCDHPWRDHSKRGRAPEAMKRRCHGDNGACPCSHWMYFGDEYDPQAAEIADDEFVTRYTIIKTLDGMARELRQTRRMVDGVGCLFHIFAVGTFLMLSIYTYLYWRK